MEIRETPPRFITSEVRGRDREKKKKERKGKMKRRREERTCSRSVRGTIRAF